MVFSDSEKLRRLNEITHPYILLGFQEELYGKKGVILVNAALTAETGLSYLSNNNCVLMKSNGDLRSSRLVKRGLTLDQIKNVTNSQYSFAEKEAKLREAIGKDKHGHLWVVENGFITNYDVAFQEIVDYFSPETE